MINFDYEILPLKPRFIGVVRLDIDPQSSRALIVNRRSFKPLFATSSTGMVERVVPFNFSVNADLLIIMLDDTGQFNAVCNDAIKAESVDANTL